MTQGCHSELRTETLRVGIDPHWATLSLYGQEAYVNGYVEELLLALAQETGLRFDRIQENNDALWADLREHRCDAVVAGLFPYPLYQAQYEFSPPLLRTGPLLILPRKEQSSLKDLGDKIVGVYNEEDAQWAWPYQTVLVRTYPTIPALLTAVVQHEIDAALLARVPAMLYLHDLYSDQLHSVGKPLNEAGIRLMALKGFRPNVMAKLRQGIEHLEHKGTLTRLQQKWRLAPTSRS